MIAKGIEISSVVMLNASSRLCEIPVMNMWWAHTVKLRMLAIARHGMINLFAYRGRRLKVEIRSPVIAKPGSRRTYTSGCPKNQNMWSQRSGPPWVEVKKTVPKARSATSKLRADTKAGKAQSIRRLVKIQPQVNSGSFINDIPGARSRKIVTRKFTVDTMLEAMRSMRSPWVVTAWLYSSGWRNVLEATAS